MRIKSTMAGLIVATSMAALFIPTQAAWSMKMHCTGNGWHMVSKNCNIKHAATWSEYNSGIFLKPVMGNGFLFLK